MGSLLGSISECDIIGCRNDALMEEVSIYGLVEQFLHQFGLMTILVFQDGLQFLLLTVHKDGPIALCLEDLLWTSLSSLPYA